MNNFFKVLQSNTRSSISNSESSTQKSTSTSSHYPSLSFKPESNLPTRTTLLSNQSPIPSLSSQPPVERYNFKSSVVPESERTNLYKNFIYINEDDNPSLVEAAKGKDCYVQINDL